MQSINALRAYRALRLAFALGLFFPACLTGCVSNSPNYQDQMVFQRPEDGAARLAEAVHSADPAPQLQALFGTEAEHTLSGGDPVADRYNRQIIALAMSERWTLNPIDSTTRELVIGNEHWPFPIPLVKDARGWWFDTVAGREEVLARRIGRNELSTIATLRVYVQAQRQYAAAPRDAQPAGAFAQKLRSDPGQHNGLYWPQTSAADQSPLGRFVADASAEGYSPQTAKEGAAPYHGYFFRILTKQGPAASGGAQDYIVNGGMTGGFAMIAFPAEYGNSGVMSFIVGPDGVVYQADLGDSTTALAAQIVSYDPAPPWRPVD